MPTVASDEFGSLHIPDGVKTVAKFCRWVDSADLPEKLPIHFLRNDVWVDVSMEEMFSHNRIKTALGIALGRLIEDGDLGMYATDGMALANEAANIVTEPDAMFISNATVASGRIQFSGGRKRGAVATRVVGTPDLVVEIVSPSSEDKDTAWLMSAYHNAEIPEYWLIDARDEDDTRFTIYRRGPKGYTAARRSGGWTRSPVFGREFRLVRQAGATGHPRYKLEVR
jgi:Uma2 family endonuclease